MELLSQFIHARRVAVLRRVLLTTFCLGLLSQLSHGFDFFSQRGLFTQPMRLGGRSAKLSSSEKWNGEVPLVIKNKCDSTIWPGIATQNGKGPGVGGFELASGRTREMWVSPDWQGRVWGRTNCTVNGESAACKTGDCLGKLDCEFSGSTPATLVEFNLAGGVGNAQTFYDISLVDGYNLPMGLNYIPAKNTTFIPPNLTNCVCIATPGWIFTSTPTGTYYSNSTYPVPLESRVDNKSARNWCPWPLLAFPPKKPGDGIYPYPDDNIQRPEFSPCNSACTATGSDKDCCVGKYHDPDICKPSEYSLRAKTMCPDAYSYAFDDKKSTFIIPKGGGFEVVICPRGRSTNILRQLGSEMSELSTSGRLSVAAFQRLENVTYIETDRSRAAEVRPMTVAAAGTALFAGILLAL